MRTRLVAVAAGLWAAVIAGAANVAELPAGVRAVWSAEKAYREGTAARERVCVNGLWRWQPVIGEVAKDAAPPAGGWGYFKVPGPWPGAGEYMQQESQAVFAHPAWRDAKLGAVRAAWYQREVSVPAGWAGRRVTLALDYVNSSAVAFVDGKRVGEAAFPAGEIDLTSACAAGRTHTVSLLVTAMPLKAVLLAYTDSAAAREVKGNVARRGLCGDAYLVGAPAGPRVEDARVRTGVRDGRVTFDAAVANLPAGAGRYALRARVFDQGKPVAEFTGKAFAPAELADGRASFTADWKADRLWDLHTPQNQYEVQVALLDEGGKVLDEGWRSRFGARELRIDGRDFYLNGSRVFLSAVPLDNAQIGAAWSTYDGARETFERLKTFGINFVYTHNYDCGPGAHLGFEEILRAADDAGVLVALTQPHFSQYDWKAAGADERNGYARHAAFYARVAGNHPSVVFYATSHNACGYDEDMNPDLIDGTSAPRGQWGENNAKLALRAEAIVRRLDPGRIVYHHASGNLGSMYPINFYANWAPAQEMSDWFGHWAEKGVKPVFLCEYGVPFTWDWTMYRGWWNGKREFGSARVPWEFCAAEWNAQALGDRAFKIGDAERANIRWEAKQYREGSAGWNRWDYPAEVGSPRLADRYEVFARYLEDNWRAFRTWGVSANSPWEYGHYWTPRGGADRGRRAMAVDWDALQRPGFSADFADGRFDRMDVTLGRDDWQPTAAAKALVRNNRPLLAYVGGRAGAFTEKGHVFSAGERVEKQVVVINNSRRRVRCAVTWSLDLPAPANGAAEIDVATGEIAFVPVAVDLPNDAAAAGRRTLRAEVRFTGEGIAETQPDALLLDVLAPATAAPEVRARVALFDPKGETAAVLKNIGVAAEAVDAAADLSAHDVLVIGKDALSVGGAGPDVARRVREGMRVVVFEQAAEVLEKRLGFRTAEYGLRNAFARQPDHPMLAGVSAEMLRDWRGASTLLPPRLKYELVPMRGPTVRWCDIPVPHVWRCGNRGTVASVLIEKPARGDFRAVVDGGFGLEYAPLIECRDGRGMIVFCQLDVCGRTEAEPAARAVVRNVMAYAAEWKAAGPARRVVYAGEPAGAAHLRAGGVELAEYDAGKLAAMEQVLVAGPGAGAKLAADAKAIEAFVSGGGRVLAIGLDEQEAGTFLPVAVRTKRGEHIGAYVDAPAGVSPLAGVSPAEVLVRDPRDVPLVSGGVDAVIGGGVLATAAGGRVVFCQLVPWQYDPDKAQNQKRTYRRVAVLVSRVLGNLGAEIRTPVAERIGKGVTEREAPRWAEGLYLDRPAEWDYPYRFFRW